MATSILNKAPLIPKPNTTTTNSTHSSVDSTMTNSIRSTSASTSTSTHTNSNITSNTNMNMNTSSVSSPKEKPLWLNAWYDPLSNIHSISECMIQCDLNGDGDYKLCIADQIEKKLKIYKNQCLYSEHALLDTPIAIQYFYSDTKTPQQPSIAVAASSYIFIYRNMRPYYKFTIPSIEIHSDELNIWNTVKQLYSSATVNGSGSTGTVTGSGGDIDINHITEQLKTLHSNGILLSSRSMTYLSLQSNDNKLQFLIQHMTLPLQQHSVITCMITINKYKSYTEDSRAVSQLIVGTENKYIYIMDPTGTYIVDKWLLPSVPVNIAVYGLYDIDYRLSISCRNGHIYTIKRGKLLSTVIELDSQPITQGGVLIDPENGGKSIYIACMNGTIHNYHVKGKKQYTIYLTSTTSTPIPSLSSNTTTTPLNNNLNGKEEEYIVGMTYMKSKNIHGILVATSTGHIHLYHNKYRVHTIYHINNSTNTVVHSSSNSDVYTGAVDIVTGMKYGSYGREENCLCIIYGSGALCIKILRSATMDIAATQQQQHGIQSGPPYEQDIPLNIPKKTKLYVEQTQRERDQAVEMHRIFQRDLVKLRLNTAKTYVDVIQGGIGVLSSNNTYTIRIDASIQGLGRLFKLTVNVQNTGQKILYDIPICYHYNPDVYKFHNNTSHIIPMLIPTVEYTYSVYIRCIDVTGRSDTIRIYVADRESANASGKPHIAAVIQMPQSEIPTIDN